AVLNPGIEARMVYSPGGRSAKRVLPSAFVIVVRLPSREGLSIATVTPGSPSPSWSWTVTNSTAGSIPFPIDFLRVSSSRMLPGGFAGAQDQESAKSITRSTGVFRRDRVELRKGVDSRPPPESRGSSVPQRLDERDQTQRRADDRQPQQPVQPPLDAS